MAVYLQVIRCTLSLHAVIDYIRIRAITAKIEGHELWQTVIAFLSAQAPFIYRCSNWKTGQAAHLILCMLVFSSPILQEPQGLCKRI